MYTDYTSFEDILKASNLTVAEFEEQTKNDTVDERGYKKVKLFTKVLNGDWTPDYQDTNQWKYENIFYVDDDGSLVFDGVNRWNPHSFVGSRLCFRDRNTAEYAGRTFIKEYQEWML